MCAGLKVSLIPLWYMQLSVILLVILLLIHVSLGQWPVRNSAKVLSKILPKKYQALCKNFASLNISRFILSVVQTLTELVIKNISLLVHFFISQIYSHAENTSQIKFKGHFSALTKPKQYSNNISPYFHKNVLARNIEQVLGATPHKAPTIRPPASHHENSKLDERYMQDTAGEAGTSS